MTTWLWLNLSLGALFVLAVVGVPPWLVIARPDTGPQHMPARGERSPRRTASRRPSARTAGMAPATRSGPPARRTPAGVS